MLVAPGAPGKPGLFPDLREARAAVAQFAGGRRVLNLFAHTGAFSAAAARAGASEVVSVDLSGRYLELARRNVELNAPGFAPLPAARQASSSARIASSRIAIRPGPVTDG